MVCGDWEQPVLVGRKAHFRTAIAEPCPGPVGLSDCRNAGRQWKTVDEHAAAGSTVGLTVGQLSDCRTVGLSDCRNCRTTVRTTVGLLTDYTVGLSDRGSGRASGGATPTKARRLPSTSTRSRSRWTRTDRGVLTCVLCVSTASET